MQIDNKLILRLITYNIEELCKGLEDKPIIHQAFTTINILYLLKEGIIKSKKEVANEASCLKREYYLKILNNFLFQQTYMFKFLVEIIRNFNDQDNQQKGDKSSYPKWMDIIQNTHSFSEVYHLLADLYIEYAFKETTAPFDYEYKESLALLISSLYSCNQNNIIEMELFNFLYNIHAPSTTAIDRIIECNFQISQLEACSFNDRHPVEIIISSIMQIYFLRDLIMPYNDYNKKHGFQKIYAQYYNSLLSTIQLKMKEMLSLAKEGVSLVEKDTFLSQFSNIIAVFFDDSFYRAEDLESNLFNFYKNICLITLNFFSIYIDFNLKEAPFNIFKFLMLNSLFRYNECHQIYYIDIALDDIERSLLDTLLTREEKWEAKITQETQQDEEKEDLNFLNR